MFSHPSAISTQNMATEPQSMRLRPVRLLLLLPVIVGVGYGRVLYVFGEFGPRQGIGQVPFHDEARYRRCNRTAESSVFHVDRNGYLRVVLRCEAQERGVVGTVRILGRSRLAADVEAGNVGPAARPSVPVHGVVPAVHHLS